MVALAEGEKRPLFAMLDALRPLGTSFVPPPEDVAARAPSPVIDAVRRASRQAGGGATGAGLGVRELLRQTFVVAPREVANAVTDPVVQVARPAGDFLSALVGGPQSPSPARTSAQAPNYPTLRSVVSPEQTAPAPALTRTPSRGQPAPAAPAPIATTPRQAAPVYSMDSVPAGGGYMEWGDRGARGGAGSLSVTPQRARELSGQSSIVPAGTIPQLGLGSQPAYTAPQGLGRPDAPRRSTLISDRSQDFDSVLKNLVAQATREPDSYGELFRRKGVLNALNDIAGVATSAGTNAAQDIANVRNAVEQRLNTELTDQSREADRGVTTRGQDRLFQSGLLQNMIAARNADLQATTTREVAADRNAVLREGQKARSADSAAQRASQERIYAGAAERELGSNPLRQLDAQIIKRVNADLTPMSDDDLARALALRDRLQAQANPYQFLLPQAQ